MVYFLYQMEFEFDPAKSSSNLRKHGIDFVGAQALWQDPDRLEIPARSTDGAANAGDRPHRKSAVVRVHDDS